jgi:DNA-binding transcriptional regulator/RsmH inhibitor MraZ
MITQCDAKGRVYIPKALQKKLTKEVFIVETAEGILIIPIPNDPFQELERLGQKLPAMTIKQLKEEITKQATQEMR